MLAAQDQSLRAPVLLLVLSSLLWLLAGSLAHVMAFVKLHAPGMMAGSAWLTYGRLHPAATNALLYGFASQAGLAIALWMMSRLGRTPLANPGFAVVGWFVWNLALPIGIGGILLGDTTGFEWLEMPRYASPVLFFAYALIAATALMTLAKREEKTLFVSDWFILAALFWFPWVWSVGHLLLAFHPLRGVMQAAVHGWAANGIATLWLTPLGLGLIYYFIPKITGRPIYSRGLAQFGFWTMAIFGAWGGLSAGMPLPSWVVSISVAAGVCMIVPLVANAANWTQTICGPCDDTKRSLPFLFITAAATNYVLVTLLSVFTSARGLSKLTNFTYLNTAQEVLLIFGLIGLSVSAAIYYLVPRLARTELCCHLAPRLHYFGSLGGLILATVGLVGGGLIQGGGLANPDRTMLEIVKATKPWLMLSAAGLLILFLANCFLVSNVVGVLIKMVRSCVRESGLLDLIPATAAVKPSQTRRDNAGRPERVEPPTPTATKPQHKQQPPRHGKKRRNR